MSTRDDLIAIIAEAAGCSKAKAGETLSAVTEHITSELASGADIRLPGFGTFLVADRAASEGRNPRTGEKIDIPASRQAKFKPAKHLKQRLAEAA